MESTHSPNLSPTAMCVGQAEFNIHGGQFNHIHGDATYHLGPNEDSAQLVRRLVEKDSSLNQYSAEHGTVSIPHFSKSLLLQDLQVDPDAGRISTGSCAFDLLAHLGLFPGQPNEALAQYDTSVPLDAVVSRGNCYCGRISRHGFIFLVSKYFQHATMGVTTNGGTCFILSTSIGRFKCYDIDDFIFVHFDSGTRSSYVDLVKDQNLDDILRISRGEYQVISLAVRDSGSVDVIHEWHRGTAEPIEKTASAQLYGIPNAVNYMTKSTLQRWKRLEAFAQQMIDAVLSTLDGITEPAEFVSAIKNLPHVVDNRPSRDLPSSTPAEKLAACIFLYRELSHRSIREWSHQIFYNFTATTLPAILLAHQFYRSPRVELPRLITTSHDRFLRILDGFQALDDVNGAGRLSSNDYCQRELQTLLTTNRNNVALVATQGYFAMLLKWNASRILLSAREAPDEWIRFVGADDDMLFIG